MNKQKLYMAISNSQKNVKYLDMIEPKTVMIFICTMASNEL